jgi:hypothetical protein
MFSKVVIKCNSELEAKKKGSVAGLLMMVLILCVPFEKLECCHFDGGNINGHFHGIHV